MSTTTSIVTSQGLDQVDIRGPRFVAWVTTGVLIGTLLVSAISVPAATIILALQAVVFAIGAVRGPRQHPYGRVFAALIAPQLGPVTEKEPVPPLKFAQLVGFIFAVVGTVGFAFQAALGGPLLGLIATALALFAAFLNAAFGICLGCQIYPFVARLRRATPATSR
ncbi:DUF4395 domain-containing protein [Mycolicibacterium fluoranthenivorans]|uniref:DUF4395 domain-containing protein n=1 Tax=Mycolicibacterium fluoranthenivorans TaxID=258505 RepID=A0A7X5ZF37_9MYCO|nr:DUF4395 domain-containing protein [Mycolicibacterium fluoranthenivorans]MCV7356338.1 DUF4395 domain-containing protein [Mycolicibacterium fluoranthenivorans]NIH97738.1 hypothetical protein [Mycolicibacterium fluoranthenivorans]